MAQNTRSDSLSRELCFQTDYEPVSGPREVQSPPLLIETAKRRFGFSWQGVAVQPESALMSIPATGKLMMQYPFPVLPDDQSNALRAFLQAVCCGSLHPLSDLHPKNPCYLLTHRLPHINASRLCVKDSSEGPLYQIITPSTPSSDYALVVSTSTTAVQCLRDDLGDTEHDILVSLLSRGISCGFYRRVSTCEVPDPGVSTPNLKAPKFCHGVGYLPSFQDYQRYVVRRDAFLKGARGRVALLKGGIFWRLARDAVGIAAALEGPSFVDAGGQVHWSKSLSPIIIPGEHPDEMLVEEDLSVEEINLICGAYEIYTGRCNQYTRQSWWPRPADWNASTMDQGFWGAFNERWFNERLREIENGSAKLIQLQKWTPFLRREQKVTPFRENYEKHCEQFLRLL